MACRETINAKCKSCVSNQEGPGRWRQKVMACVKNTCESYKQRPLPTTKKSCVESFALIDWGEAAKSDMGWELPLTRIY